ncbi:MAG: hypothetical protein AAF721_25415 [Myxococcota bacterium]
MRTAVVIILALAFAACDKQPDAVGNRPPPHVDPPRDPGAEGGGAEPVVPEPQTDDRVPVVPAAHPQYARLEGDGYPNACAEQSDCYAGGCSGEVCSAERDVITTCEALPKIAWPADTSCACVASQCQWVSPTGTTLPVPSAEGEQCGDEVCTKPKECIRYYGIAGKKGPEFTSCEIRCKAGAGGCPAGQSCVTIADGPGSVCR